MMSERKHDGVSACERVMVDDASETLASASAGVDALVGVGGSPSPPLAKNLRRGMVVGHLEVFDAKDDRDPYIPFGRVGILFFDPVAIRYHRATFKPNEPVDPACLPEWANRPGCSRI